MSTGRLDVTIDLVRVAIRTRRELADALRDKGGQAFQAIAEVFRAIAEAFEEDIAVLEQARDALVEARVRTMSAEARKDWSGEVVVCLRHHIRSEWPGSTAAAASGEQKGRANPHGAISVGIDGGRQLGAKPADILWWRYADSEVRFVWVLSAWMPESIAGVTP